MLWTEGSQWQMILSIYGCMSIYILSICSANNVTNIPSEEVET